ncbi:CDP-glycerol glycerophosphotransferase family protein [Microbacterium sp. M3]|uniref:CDP-glycerol glycerophosphotransferase family protein n=3 Tax=Microbacterium arthrosphaerae TaxID=792652 RepID=A0ABU4H102_9MICO|nr:MULTISPECIES: CDP-glycerol glycerophosphotransferase family protein [Microbacterium]MDW4573010.1 CDP-glycerol glycerophosphotransferase family protein [Microbacterium arthrosphaerae]MDW7606865.1 CDP-glycerol glycerophosphotransferase family protein [Microbacterium sp. M3]
MASFSFGAGNARKLATIPLYAAGRMLTLLVPRSRDQWVFGCAVGIGDGALAVWEQAAADDRRAVWLVGTAREARDAAARGIPSIPKRSMRGLWRTARARVIVVTHGFGDVNRYAVSGAYVVQLWHGIPLKRIGLDSLETLRTPGVLARTPAAVPVRVLLRAMFRGAARRIRLLPAASHLVRGRLESAFALPDRSVPVTGEPRVDVLSRGTAADRRTAARAAIARAVPRAPHQGALVLYAPTWRDGAVDPAVPTPEEWARIVDVLDRRDATLLVRSHPLGAGDYVPPFPTPRVQALGSDLVSDITPLLPGLDALVTDYSSLAFDAALVPLPTLFLAPDVDAYARRRGFYGTYRDVAGDDWAPGWAEAAGQLDALLGDPAERARLIARASALSARVHAFRDGRNAQRVYRAILAGTAQDARPREGNG